MAPSLKQLKISRIQGLIFVLVVALVGIIYLLVTRAAVPSTLYLGQRLAPGQYLQSPSGTYQLTLQTNGQVTVAPTGGGSNQGSWTGGVSTTTPASLALLLNGNLAELNTAGVVIWQTHTDGSGATHLGLDDSGGLTLYNPSGAIIWTNRGGVQINTLASGQRILPGHYLESSDGLRRLVLQTNGNLVLSSTLSGQVDWSNSGSGASPAALTMRSDGDLIESSTTGAIIWQSGSTGIVSSTTLSILDNGGFQGVLLIEDQGGQTVWDSRFGLEALPTTLFGFGGKFSVGEELRSSNGYSMYLSANNLAVYNPLGAIIWTDNTINTNTSYLTIQGNCNLAQYSSSGMVVWSSQTNCWGSGANLTMQTDGNLVLSDTGNQPLWSSQGGRATLPSSLADSGILTPNQILQSSNGQYNLVMQPNGSVVVFNLSNDQVVWSGGALGTTPQGLFMQTDGNLVEYATSGAATWSSGTYGMINPTNLVLQNDGDLVIYLSDGTPIWSSQTGIISASTVVPNGTFGAYPATIQSNARGVLKAAPPETMSCTVNGVSLGLISGTGTYTTSQLPAGTQTYQIYCKAYCLPGHYCNDFVWAKLATLTILGSSTPPNAPAQPTGPYAEVVGCNQWSNGTCLNWFYTGGGPNPLYADNESYGPIAQGATIPNYVYVDDTTGACGALPISAPINSVISCMNTLVKNLRTQPQYQNAIIYAAVPTNAPISTRITGADVSLYEWYPFYGVRSTTLGSSVSCGPQDGHQGYIIQRYFNGNVPIPANLPSASTFTQNWSDAITKCKASVVAWW